MRYLIATLAILLSLASTAAADTRSGVLGQYAGEYATDQGWVLTESPVFAHGDYRRSYFTIRYLANPAPGASNCFGDVVYVDMPGCPAKFYEDDGPFWMDVQARVARCGPGWYVVSTPLDQHSCRTPVAWRW